MNTSLVKRLENAGCCAKSRCRQSKGVILGSRRLSPAFSPVWPKIRFHSFRFLSIMADTSKFWLGSFPRNSWQTVFMNRSEIADMFCLAIFSGSVQALFDDVVSENTTWIVVSGTDPSNSERRFLGIRGLDRLAGFCHESLKIASGEMTGCVMKGDCLFAFGKFRFGDPVEGFSSETSFAIKLVWHRLQIVCAEIRIMWPLPPTDIVSG